MNQSQKIVKDYMDQQIGSLEHGLDCLEDREYQPNELGDLYNGMLKHSVSYEIRHMEHLRDDLLDKLKG